MVESERIKLLAATGRQTKCKDGKVSAEYLADEVRETTHIMASGFAHNPASGKSYTIFEGGNRSQGWSIVTDNTAYNVATDDVVIYGHDMKIHISSNGVQINASKLTINADKTKISGDVAISGNVSVGGMAAVTGVVAAAGYGGGDGAPASMSGGANISGSMKLNNIPVAVTTHTHTDAEGRPTSTAQ